MRNLVILIPLVLTAASPASAQWSTTTWTVAEEAVLDQEPTGERARIAAKHIDILNRSSAWFQSMGLPEPYQVTTDEDAGILFLAQLKTDASEITSGHNAAGKMRLTSHPGFLHTSGQIWTLMESSAVHEVFHGIQKALSPSYLTYVSSNPPPPKTACDGAARPTEWLTEGTASAVQARWVEHETGQAFPRPFEPSDMSRWVRYYDQPLHRQPSGTRPSGVPRDSTRSWSCGYASWYFWYAAGEMLALGSPPEDAVTREITYMRFLFEHSASWRSQSVALADVGLRRAARAYGSLAAYQDGLYDLYPRFLAEYADTEAYYEHVYEVDVGTPGLATVEPSLSADLEALSARAFRVRVTAPAQTSALPTPVRFSLSSVSGRDRDFLHLIVESEIAGRPIDDQIPLTHTVSIPPGVADTTFLVRVANVPELEALSGMYTDDTMPAIDFALQVEVGGFYGDEVPTGNDRSDLAAAVGGELPPGFSVTGPDELACEGGAGARAVFDLVTPKELARDVERAMPQAEREAEENAEDMEVLLARMRRAGVEGIPSEEQMAELRARIEAARREAEAVRDRVDVQAQEGAATARSRSWSSLSATFVGEGGCQMTLNARLDGADAGAQVVVGAVEEGQYPRGEEREFGVAVYTSAMIEALQRGTVVETMQASGPAWQFCAMNDERRARVARGGRRPACSGGRLTLEQAEQGRVAGTFEFDVVRDDQKATVRGHFNVASTDDGRDDNTLSGGALGIGAHSGALVRAGTPILTYEFED